VNLTLSAKATNLNASSQLLIMANLRAASSGSLTQVMAIPSHGVNQLGEVVQTLQLSGLFQPSNDSESLLLSVTEKMKRAITGLSAVIQLTKINAQVVDQAKQNSVALKSTAAKAPVAKAPVAKAPVAKAPVAKAPVAKAPVAKAPVAKAPVAKAPVVTQKPKSK
jgi:hypothetical protein